MREILNVKNKSQNSARDTRRKEQITENKAREMLLIKIRLQNKQRARYYTQQVGKRTSCANKYITGQTVRKVGTSPNEQTTKQSVR